MPQMNQAGSDHANYGILLTKPGRRIHAFLPGLNLQSCTHCSNFGNMWCLEMKAPRKRGFLSPEAEH